MGGGLDSMRHASVKTSGNRQVVDLPRNLGTSERLSRRVIDVLSRGLDEPGELHGLRVRALELFARKRLPKCNGELLPIDFERTNFGAALQPRTPAIPEEMPREIKDAISRLGLTPANNVGRRVTSQSVSERLCGEIRERLARQGVIFADLHAAWREHREMVSHHFGSVVHAGDDKFAAFNTAVWSGGTFVYVPKGVHVDVPLHPDMRPGPTSRTAFERVLIVCDEDSRLEFIEGCVAPTYLADSLRVCVAEVVVQRGAQCRYTTLQNWSRNVQDAATQRAAVHAGGSMTWIDCSLGGRITWKQPKIDLHEAEAQGEIMSLSVAGDGQSQHGGGKAVHHAPHTASRIRSHSVSHGGGRTTHRGQVKLHQGCRGATARFDSDALLVHEGSRNDTFPLIEMDEKQATVGHESRVSRVNDEQLFYLKSRGMDEAEALRAMVDGFLEPALKALPMEYAVEVRQWVESEIENHAS